MSLQIPQLVLKLSNRIGKTWNGFDIGIDTLYLRDRSVTSTNEVQADSALALVTLMFIYSAFSALSDRVKLMATP